MRLMTCVALLLAITLWLLPSDQAAFAGYMHPQLQEKASSNPGDFYDAYIFIREDSQGLSLSKTLNLDLYTRQAAHSLAIRHLKQTANSSQRDLLELLDRLTGEGSVTDFRSYWIDNVIRVRGTGEILNELSARSDVDKVMEIPDLSLIHPVGQMSPSSPNDTVQSSLRVIGADQMWALGYTGAGRLVCNIDTGVDGAHPALSSSWRGNNGYSWQESWFDPVDGDSFPHVFPSAGDKKNHGTHTMGTMVGRDDATGDTVGVAIGAQWIAAAVVDIPEGKDILGAFEWVADPDGNPNTVGDVPDVVSNSWGYPQEWLGCEPVYWNAIDNLEALGSVVLFAAGNSGGSPSTIVNPANRATSPYNSFAVGAVDPRDPGTPIASFSSRGPSDCDGVSLKPQAVAPGEAIRSTISVDDGSYGTDQGTSMACPHIAGAVAILRQYNPDAPADSIKKALMETAIDLGDPGPDNTYGYGLIDIPAAMSALAMSDLPNLYLSDMNVIDVDPGDTVDLVLEIGNDGLGIIDVIGKLRAVSPQLEILDSAHTYGAIQKGTAEDNNSDPYVIAIDEGIPQGTELNMELNLTGSDFYDDDISIYLRIRIDPEPVRSTFAHDVGNVSLGLSNYGILGLGPASILDLGQPGLVWPNDGSGSNNLYELALLAGVDADHVSDNARNQIFRPDNDFDVAIGGNLVFINGGPNAEQESYSLFEDSHAESPIGLTIRQHTLAFENPPHDDYIMLIYRIYNNSALDIDSLYVGLAADWDWPYNEQGAGDRDRVGYSFSEEVGYMLDADSIANPDYRGFAVLNSAGIASFKAIKNVTYLWDGNGLTESEKWGFLTGGIQVTSSYLLEPDHSCLISTGPYEVTVGDSVEVAFAVIGASSVEDLNSSAQSARQMYDDILTDADDVLDDDIIPREFTLRQNYPNPFNPSTTIEFYLDRSQNVSLSVYNLLGQKVATVVDRSLGVGKHSVIWDASGMPSGVYFYKLIAGDKSVVRKMLLLK